MNPAAQDHCVGVSFDTCHTNEPHRHHKAPAHWIIIAKGLRTLRTKADRIGGRQTFRRLREQAGLGEKAIPPATVTRLDTILDNLPAVMSWHQRLDEQQQFRWASPSAVFKHCPVFKKDGSRDGDRLSPMAQLKQANMVLQEENHKLKQREDGDRFKPTDSARDIAVTMVGMFSPTKAETIFRQGLELLKARGKRKRTDEAPTEADHAATEVER
jgi:hypothetical protein